MDKLIIALSLALVLFAAPAFAAHTAHPYVDEPLTDQTVKVSEHVWMINGFPNIAIIVGKGATLIVDTGLGKESGATVTKAAKKLAPSNRFYLTTTHFHPEHAAGVLGFPVDTVLIRDQVQQSEMEAHGEEMITMFAGRKDRWKSLLAGEQLRPPDVTFDRELRLNLGGGVSARLLWFGGAHTKGDELVFVDPDHTLVSGDVVQNKVGPAIYKEGGTAASWIAVVEKIAELGAQHVIPDHSPAGDGDLVKEDLSFLKEVRSQALALRKKGESAEKAGKLLTEQFQKAYPAWAIDDLTAFTQATYAESK